MVHGVVEGLVRDFGPQVLSNPQLLKNLLGDKLPTAPREASLLVAAAEAGVAGMLKERLGQSIPADAAVHQTSVAFEERRGYDTMASSWVVTEFARALGHEVTDPASTAAQPPAVPPQAHTVVEEATTLESSDTCANCGQPLAPGASFCGACGHRVSQPVVATAQPAPVAPPVPPTTPSVPKRSPLPFVALALAVVFAGIGVYELVGHNGGGPASSPAPLTDRTTSASSKPPTPPPGAQYFSRIDSISLASAKYVVNFETFGFKPQQGGANKHVHFFFDTVSEAQAGRPGNGPWQVYPTSTGTIGGSPFTLLGPSDAPAGAKKMCILVANSDHSVMQGTGNCVNLP